MKLNLMERLTEEELVEIRKRVFSFADQMFMEGISVGRELSKDDFHSSTEDFVRDRISAMTSYFVRDDIWESMPPTGYNPDPNVDIPEPSQEMMDNFGKAIETADNIDDIVNNPVSGSDDDISEEKPEWADKPNPFG